MLYSCEYIPKLCYEVCLGLSLTVTTSEEGTETCAAPPFCEGFSKVFINQLQRILLLDSPDTFFQLLKS